MSRPTGSRNRKPEPRKAATQRARQPQREPGSARSVAIAVSILTVLVIGTLLTVNAADPKGEPGAWDPEIVAEGSSLFSANCAQCHGADLRGTDTGPPFLVPTYAPNHHSLEAFQRAVADGVTPHHWSFGPMPPVAGLSRDDVAKIVAFVRSSQEAEGIFLDPTH